MNYDEIIMSLSEIADQPTEDGMVDGVNQQTIRDALDLINYQHEHIEAFLRDHEPRLLKLEEVKAFGWDYCYLEEERLPGKEYRDACCTSEAIEMIEEDRKKIDWDIGYHWQPPQEEGNKCHKLK